MSMRAVVVTGPGELELNYMMLPTFIGMNAALKKELEAVVKPLIEGKPWTESTVDEAHELVLDFLEKKFPPIAGLRDYLDGLKYVTDQ
jgi:hypothetical protein